jgi:hypothetical protein
MARSAGRNELPTSNFQLQTLNLELSEKNTVATEFLFNVGS